MKLTSATVTIFGHDDNITQDIDILYFIERGDERDWNIVECKVLSAIELEPSDIDEDLVNGISFAENLDSWKVRMECTPVFKITSEKVRA